MGGSKRLFDRRNVQAENWGGGKYKNGENWIAEPDHETEKMCNIYYETMEGQTQIFERLRDS